MDVDSCWPMSGQLCRRQVGKLCRPVMPTRVLESSTPTCVIFSPLPPSSLLIPSFFSTVHDPPTLFFRLQFNMPIVHYRPRVPAAAAVVPPATTKVVVPTTPLPPTKVRTSTRVVVSTARAAATTKVVPVLPTTTHIIATTPTVALTTTQPLTTSSSLISSSTIPLITSTTTTPRTTPVKTAVKATSVAFSSSPAAALASPSTSVSPTSGVSGGTIAAGVIGGLVGIAVTSIVVAFVLRRWHRNRSRSRESMNFDAKNFRRSAVMLESSPPPLPPDFGSRTSVRSVPMAMDYRHHQTSMVAHHYPYMHAQAMHSPYTPDTPSYGSSPDYHIPPNPFYVPPRSQGYPPEMHRQGSGGGLPGAAPPHYHYENHEDAYGGM
ncbi:hypothetical protein MVEN_01848600 [Mycena venus]|uniref:Transmembrane protein n=1 Tax=Mycena venus TaxID=2733690 RepID=A0A8H7CKP4_9AGAR|nr:hypothetical protein MVEN_01848600 [Mycena venus]